MVNEVGGQRATETFSFRMSVEMKNRLEKSARANRRTISREIALRLAASLGLEPEPDGPESPIASETAKRALVIAEHNDRRLDAVERRLADLEARLPIP